MCPRLPRLTPAAHWYHVGNRAVDRKQFMREDAEYEGFLALLAEALRRYPVQCVAYEPMPNHFHLVVKPETDPALSAFMQFLQGRHACDLRFFTQTRGQGHVYQSRFWHRAIRDENHFLCVLRYVEGNALRAQLVSRAEDWRWGSLHERLYGGRELLSPSPVPLPSNWQQLVNQGCTPEELDDLRRPGRRGRPPKKGSDPIS